MAGIVALCMWGIIPPCSLKDAHAKGSANGSASVLEYHNGPRRDGVYADPTLTGTSARSFHIDHAFRARIEGAVYAQVLYVARGDKKGQGVIIAASEEDVVAAFDAATGRTLWKRRLGAPVPLSRLPCGDINPLGITGTPVIDKNSRTIFLDAMTTPDGGRTKRHLVFALSLADGLTLKGWPVDVAARIRRGWPPFDSGVQNQRGALAFFKGTVYVPYGGHFGDCGSYRGWLVGIPVADPARPLAWAAGSPAGGSWAPGGAASDGRDIFISTGNTGNPIRWSGGEAVLRFKPGPVFSGKPADYFAPADWRRLDERDADLGGTGPIILDLPRSRPSRLIVVLGKDGKIYLLDRDNLGGVGGQVAAARVAASAIIGSGAAYETARGTYVVFSGKGIHCPPGRSGRSGRSGRMGDLVAVRIVPGAPPSIETAWCARQHGRGSPMVTTTNGHPDVIVWSVGAEGDNRLHGFDGDTGRVVYSGGGRGDFIGRVRRYQTPILAGGRIYIAADGKVVAFTR
ncbi:MAG: hypothetical protein M0Z58_02370 [Nitrospiraceae bacterium]|nr:hypothetical protein [Nitrospiraceae bacterium]